MEKLDFKKTFKDLYLPKTQPMEIDVPEMKFIMVDGKGNPNDEDGKRRRYHEIYLSDPRKCSMERMKTVIRHPVRMG